MTRARGGRSQGLAGWVAGTMLVATLLMFLFASPAGAKIVVDKFTGQKLGILPSPSSLARPANRTAGRRSPGTAGVPTCSTVVDSNCKTALAYHGGAVQHAENDYLFFWDPNSFAAAQPGYVAGMQTWLNDVAASDYTTGNSAAFVGNPISVTQQYYDLSGPGKTKRFVPYDVSNAGTITDTDPFPASGCTDGKLPRCLTQAQLIHELSTYITNPAHPYPTGVNTEYFILTPPGVGGCADSHNTDCFVSSYCAWHSVGGTAAHLIIYAFQPYLYNTGCDVNKHTGEPNIYSSGIDSVVGTFSHELSETMTDPTLNGWYSNSFDEIGDKCAYQYDVGQSYEVFPDLPTTVGASPYNTVLGSDDYLLQTEYSNRQHGCAQWDTDVQPTATLNGPSTATAGLPATFSVSNFTGATGTSVAYVTWHFGDGLTAVSNGTTPINHYFQVAGGGPYTVTAIVTDTRGNEVTETAPSTVTVTAPSPSDIQTAVNAPITPTGAGAKIENLLASGGYTFSFSALTAGTFSMVWKHGTTTVAAVSKSLSILGPNRLKLTLTPAGRSLLNTHGSLFVKSSDSFLTSTPPAFTDTATFTLVR